MECGASMKVSMALDIVQPTQLISSFCCIVDYILFITAPVTLEPNMNEVSDVKWVDAAELNDLMTKLDRE